MKIIKKLKYQNDDGLECFAYQFEDDNVAIIGALKYIIEESNDALKRADEILKSHGYICVAITTQDYDHTTLLEKLSSEQTERADITEDV